MRETFFSTQNVCSVTKSLTKCDRNKWQHHLRFAIWERNPNVVWPKVYKICDRDEGRLLLRRGDGLRLWYAALREAVDRWVMVMMKIDETNIRIMWTCVFYDVLHCRAQGRGQGMSVEDLDRRGIFSEKSRGRRRTARTKEDKEGVKLLRASSRVWGWRGKDEGGGGG